MNKGQTKTISLVEQTLNVLTGFLISLGIWTFIIIPVFNIDTNFGENFLIVCIFTIASILKGYFWRRLFNWLHIKYGNDMFLKLWEKVSRFSR